MQINIHGRNIKITKAIREYAEKKLFKTGKFFHGLKKMLVELEVKDIKNLSRSHVAQVTVWLKNQILRAEESASDLYAAIDLIFANLERQIREYKEKLIRTSRHQSRKIRNVTSSDFSAGEDISTPRLVSTKKFAIKPMSIDEAIMQMTILKNSFFVFKNADSEQVNVVYKRTDGDCGLIEPEF